MHSGAWEVVAETLYWIQLIWVLSGFALMAYLAFRVFPWRSNAQDFLSSRRTATRFSVRNGADESFDIAEPSSKPQMIVAGNYRFELFQDSGFLDRKH